MIEEQIGDIDNIIIEELEKEGSFFENLYKLAFSSYKGFDNVNFVKSKELGINFNQKK